MKLIITAMVIVMLCPSLNAQQSQLFSCGPDYPVQNLSEHFDSILADPNGNGVLGTLWHNGALHGWYTNYDTTHLFRVDETQYQETILPGTDSTYGTYAHVFSLNGDLYYTHALGISDSSGATVANFSNPQYWFVYDDLVEQNVAWLFAGDAVPDLRLLKFDGSTIVEYTYGVIPGGKEPFSIGDDIFFQNGGTLVASVHTFNKTTGLFSQFDLNAFPNFAISPRIISKSLSGNLLVGGFDANQNFATQELVGNVWSIPTTLFNSVDYNVYSTGNNYIYPLQSGLILHNANWSQLHFLKPIDNEYTIFYTLNDEAAGHISRDSVGNLYYLSLEFDTSCLNSFAKYRVVYNIPTNNGEGKLFVDLNSNGLYDGTDYPLVGKMVCNAATTCVNTNSTGVYSVLLEADNFLTPFTAPNFTTVPLSYTLNSVDSSVANLDFAYQALVATNDLAVSTLYASAPPRPGFSNDFHAIVYNNGTVPVSDTLYFSFDPLHTFNSAAPAPLYQIGNVVAWLTDTVDPLLTKSFSVNLTLSTSAVLGSNVVSTAAVAALDDSNPTNGTFELEQIVQGAFDPNDKTASPSYWVQDGENIQYTVRFQNTGTDTAFNVAIRDTLDPNLNWSTFQLTHATHAATVELNPANGALAFKFNNVLLPDSNVNEPASHGMVVYNIRTHDGLVDGTFVINTASIYFDYNLPVVTNSSLNVIGEPTSVSRLPSPILTLRPNPADHVVTIYHPNTDAVGFVLSDMFGRTMLNGRIGTPSETSLEIHSLLSGMYNVSLINSTGRAIARAKFVIVR